MPLVTNETTVIWKTTTKHLNNVRLIIKRCGRVESILVYEVYRKRYEDKLRNVTGIYEIKNKVNGKKYIGQSKNVYARVRRHILVYNKEQGRERDKPLYKSMRKYGVDNFEFILVEECNESELDSKERYYIRKYDTLVNKCGYNLDSGGNSGSHNRKLSREEVNKVIKELKEVKLTNNELAEKYGISRQTLGGLSRGDTYTREKENYPIRGFTDRHVVRTRVEREDELYKKECKQCGKSMYSSFTDRKYCSKGCQLGIINKRKGMCYQCGKSVEGSEGVLYCSAKCSSNSQRKFNINKEELENMLLTTPNYTEIAKELGVTGNAIKKRCKVLGLETKLKYWTDRYVETKGYTYRVKRLYDELKLKDKETLDYVIDNYGKKTKRRVVVVEKKVGEPLYLAIGIIHNLERYNPQGRYKGNNK